jgi:pyridoxamine 5'-phosphate oxidase
MKLHDQRKQYSKDALDEQHLLHDPFLLFEQWFKLAEKDSSHEANAMVLSTCFENKPSARIVLLKEVSEGGFVFFSNYKSRKGTELDKNPNASLTFFWPELERQVRIEGVVKRVSDESSDLYFDSRPEESRISAIISPQSQIIESKAILEEKRNELRKNPENIKRPEFWGGYRLFAQSIEFWQGRPDRFHDRIQYVFNNDTWILQRLAP